MESPVNTKPDIPQSELETAISCYSGQQILWTSSTACSLSVNLFQKLIRINSLSPACLVSCWPSHKRCGVNWFNVIMLSLTVLDLLPIIKVRLTPLSNTFQNCCSPPKLCRPDLVAQWGYTLKINIYFFYTLQRKRWAAMCTFDHLTGVHGNNKL